MLITGIIVAVLILGLFLKLKKKEKVELYESKVKGNSEVEGWFITEHSDPYFLEKIAKSSGKSVEEVKKELRD